MILVPDRAEGVVRRVLVCIIARPASFIAKACAASSRCASIFSRLLDCLDRLRRVGGEIEHAGIATPRLSSSTRRTAAIWKHGRGQGRTWSREISVGAERLHAVRPVTGAAQGFALIWINHSDGLMCNFGNP